MWPRCAEVALASWLAVSPFVFEHGPDDTYLWAADFGAAAAIATLALLSYRLRRAHLFELPVAAWLLAAGWFAAGEDPRPAYENHILVGLFVLMFAILPSRASEPPPAWRDQESASQRP